MTREQHLGMMLVFLGLTLTCEARPFVTLTSGSASNGWFEYQLYYWNDPFFREVGDIALSIPPVTNAFAIEPGAPDWTNSITTNQVYWRYIATNDPRGQTFHLRLQSPNTSVRKGSGTIMFSAWLQTQYVYEEMFNLAGIMKLDCLVPCADVDADGSPPSMTSSLELRPDIAIDRLLSMSNRLRGVTFSWCWPSTMILESSSNMTSWTNVSYILGDAGSTTWTSSVPLDAVGTRFFRLGLYSTYHHPELIY
jgi:hypothetical protein